MKRNKLDNIEFVVRNGLCLSCGACYSVCKTDSIFWCGKIDKYPAVSDNCIRCGKCLKVCPGLNPLRKESKNKILGSFIECYTGYASDNEIRTAASSGGIITTLGIFMLKRLNFDGVICVKQSQDDLFQNEVFIAKSKDEILTASGSRYSPAFLCRCLKELPSDKNKKYVFVGKPCDIQAVKKFQNLYSGYNFLFISLFCARTPSASATKNLLQSNNINECEVERINYRGKGWPGFFTLYGSNGEKLFEIGYMDAWKKYLCDNEYMPKRCFLCHDCTGELADISVGDAWLERLIGKSNGHSIVIVRSQQGQSIIKQAASEGYLELETTDIEEVIHSQRSLLHKKDNIFLKHLIARMLFEKVPVEQYQFDLTLSSFRKSIGIARFLFQKKFMSRRFR